MTFSLPLPANYRHAEILAFHARDRESFAEAVSDDRIRKGLLIGGIPVVLEILLGKDRARCTVAADASLPIPARRELREIARRMLALAIAPEPFEAAADGYPWLRDIVRQQTGLRIPQAATTFEALTWAVIGQQIHLTFAISLRRTFIRLAGRQHSSGLWCYPDAASAARLAPAELGLQKFSRAKAEALVHIAGLIHSGSLDLTPSKSNSLQDIAAALIAIKGIGPWTVNYTLLRGFAAPDCSLHGDAAVRNAIQRLQGSPTKPTIGETEKILATFSPHRSLAAAHLWASLHVAA